MQDVYYTNLNIKSYKPFIKNKRIYLLRKKFIKKHLRYLKKLCRRRKHLGKKIALKRIEIWERELEALNNMYFYSKSKHDLKRRVRNGYKRTN